MDFALKFLTRDGYPCHGGSGRWALPSHDAPGEWMPVIDDLKPCRRGYHLCRMLPSTDLFSHASPYLWISQYMGDHIVHNNKVVAGRARLVLPVDTWNVTNQRLFIIDCVEHVLPWCGAELPRCREFLDTLRTVVKGRLKSAAYSSAYNTCGSILINTNNLSNRSVLYVNTAMHYACEAAFSNDRRVTASGVANVAYAATRVAGEITADSIYVANPATYVSDASFTHSTSIAQERCWQTQRLAELLELPKLLRQASALCDVSGPSS